MKITFLLIDGLNLIRRIYAAQPGNDGPERADDALKVSMQSLKRALNECQPTHVACVFDSKEPSWRHQIFPDYKAGRSPMPDELQAKLPEFQQSFHEIGVPSLTFPNLEADDVIATLANKTVFSNSTVIILSTDKSFFQLLSHRITVRDHFKKQNFDLPFLFERFHVRPEQFTAYLALTGDSTNNIPGVPTIGPRTASKLLKEFDDLDKIFTSAETRHDKIGTILRLHKNEAMLSKKLTSLQLNLSLGINLKSLRYKPAFSESREKTSANK